MYALAGSSELMIRVAGLTFNASFREKLLSQWAQGKGFTARWIRLWRFRS